VGKDDERTKAPTAQHTRERVKKIERTHHTLKHAGGSLRATERPQKQVENTATLGHIMEGRRGDGEPRGRKRRLMGITRLRKCTDRCGLVDFYLCL
jgi:hypothetical protein